MIFAGDIGGTNSRFGAFRDDDPTFEAVWTCTWPSRDHGTFGELVREALHAARIKPRALAVGVAGPVVAGVCHTTNLPWDVTERELTRVAGDAPVRLVNDLEANAWGIDLLAPHDLVTLSEGTPIEKGNRALISAGTGLGEAGLVFDGEIHRPFPCEGGHCSLSVGDDTQVNLWRHLRAIHGHVSFERVLSGPGLQAIYAFLAARGEEGKPSLPPGAAASQITAAALAGQDLVAVATLDLFVTFYGAEAGNLALKLMATGGVYIGGGIAPRIAAWLAKPAFLESFLSKGRMRPLLAAMPVRLITNPMTALRGAARLASMQMSNQA